MWCASTCFRHWNALWGATSRGRTLGIHLRLTRRAHVREQLDTIAHMLGRQLPKVDTMLRDAGPDITAFAGFPVPHWEKIWSVRQTGPGSP